MAHLALSILLNSKSESQSRKIKPHKCKISTEKKKKSHWKRPRCLCRRPIVLERVRTTGNDPGRGRLWKALGTLCDTPGQLRAVMSQNILREGSANRVESESAPESQNPPSFLAGSEEAAPTRKPGVLPLAGSAGLGSLPGRPRLTFAVAAVRDLQLRVLALRTLELAAGQEGPSVGRAERLLGGRRAVQAAVFVLILIDSQKLRGGGAGRKKKPDKFTETFCRAAVTGGPLRPLSVRVGTAASGTGRASEKPKPPSAAPSWSLITPGPGASPDWRELPSTPIARAALPSSGLQAHGPLCCPASPVAWNLGRRLEGGAGTPLVKRLRTVSPTAQAPIA